FTEANIEPEEHCTAKDGETMERDWVDKIPRWRRRWLDGISKDSTKASGATANGSACAAAGCGAGCGGGCG
ncbi:hypothetical protein A2U01_0038446, partial [Trifolium medium]|nr:hypothetical protein [Trifolium medium]